MTTGVEHESLVGGVQAVTEMGWASQRLVSLLELLVSVAGSRMTPT